MVFRLHRRRNVHSSLILSKTRKTSRISFCLRNLWQLFYPTIQKQVPYYQNDSWYIPRSDKTLPTKRRILQCVVSPLSPPPASCTSGASLSLSPWSPPSWLTEHGIVHCLMFAFKIFLLYVLCFFFVMYNSSTTPSGHLITINMTVINATMIVNYDHQHDHQNHLSLSCFCSLVILTWLSSLPWWSWL